MRHHVVVQILHGYGSYPALSLAVFLLSPSLVVRHLDHKIRAVYKLNSSLESKYLDGEDWPLLKVLVSLCVTISSH